MGSLDSIAKLSSSDLVNNYLFIMSSDLQGSAQLKNPGFGSA